MVVCRVGSDMNLILPSAQKTRLFNIAHFCAIAHPPVTVWFPLPSTLLRTWSFQLPPLKHLV